LVDSLRFQGFVACLPARQSRIPLKPRILRDHNGIEEGGTRREARLGFDPASAQVRLSLQAARSPARIAAPERRARFSSSFLVFPAGLAIPSSRELDRVARVAAYAAGWPLGPLDGHEATRAIRSDPRYDSLPIIAMTAQAMAEERYQCLSEGMNDHITKPIRSRSLALSTYRTQRAFFRPRSIRAGSRSQVGRARAAVAGSSAQAAQASAGVASLTVSRCCGRRRAC
jgi:CheY-like chemotaxis protein